MSRWQDCEELYRGRNEGMRAFVARIAPVAIEENIYPRNAHAWLVLGKARLVRAVYLLCDKEGRRFGIRWYKDGRPVMYTVKAMDCARGQRIVTWLDLAKTEA